MKRLSQNKNIKEEDTRLLRGDPKHKKSLVQIQ